MSTETKTAAGTPVTLTANTTGMTATFAHPALGGTVTIPVTWGTTANGNTGVIGHHRNTPIVLSVPRDAYDAAEAEVAARIQAVETVSLTWRQGSPLSAYVVADEYERAAMRKLGLVTDISGWGTAVRHGVAEKLGTTFAIASAAEYAASLATKAAVIHAAAAPAAPPCPRCGTYCCGDCESR